MFGLGIVVGFVLCLLAFGIVVMVFTTIGKGKIGKDNKGDNNEDSRQD